MAYYAYKTVRDLLPEHIIKQMGDDYEGDGNYGGDQWYAAEAYILELKKQRDELLEALQRVVDNAEQSVFEDWLSSNCPSGDSEQVHRKWLASSEYEDFCIDWLDERAAIAKALGENKE